MYGEKMGTVNVLLRTESGDKRLWFKKGDQGGRWNLVRLQITSSVAYRVSYRNRATRRESENNILYF